MREVILLLLCATILISAAFILTSGLIESCSDCDDGNVCTFDYCNKSRECFHEPFDGPVDGCYGTGGCVEYTCVNGKCAPSRLSNCCGNNVCEETENYSTCPRDCKATCFDGIQNQGESDVDCGGPCEPCGVAYINYLRTVGSFRDEWYGISLKYNEAINAYNRNFDLTAIRHQTFEAYSQIVGIQYRLNHTTPFEGLDDLHELFGSMIDLYLKSLDSMILYTATKNTTFLDSANNFMADSIAKDTRFVVLFNEYAERFNKLQANCNNGVYDEGEELIDCGEICNRSCIVRIAVTKSFTVENTGYGADLQLNVTPPAIDYPPYQRVLNTSFEPEPNSIVSDDEGNVGYIYKIKFKGSGITELKIRQLIELKRGIHPGKSAIKPIQVDYVLKNPPLDAEALCSKAREIKSDSKTINQTILNIHDWLNKNMEYSQDEIEHGALYAFTNRCGACDEHSDLAVAFSRCLDIPARRAVGFIVNSSSIDGHAWAEYYEDGWVYFDPSVKKGFSGMVTDGRHILSCVGSKAYSCGMSYTYIFNKNMEPNITIREYTYLS
jgi:hypothetical protein